MGKKKVVVVTHMKAGDDQHSYANNSFLPKVVISESLPIVDDALRAMFASDDDGGGATFSSTATPCFRIVDFGCSSGANTVFAISHFIRTIQHLFQKWKNSTDNNNNTGSGHNNALGMVLQVLYMIGCFQTTPFTLPFSCYSVHWLSQVPEAVDNKENIYISRETPPAVYEAYAKQYQRDFTAFLGARSKEMVRGGHMVLILRGRGAQDYSTSEEDDAEFMLLTKALLDMVAEGLIKMEEFHSFNVPIYFPCEKEVEEVVSDEGSFSIHSVGSMPMGYGGPQVVFSDMSGSIKVMTKCIVRAYMEPLLANHFGNSIVDELFKRYAEKAAQHVSSRRVCYFSIAVSLCRK